METAIEIAAKTVKKKEEKRRKKNHCHHKGDLCDCDDVKLQIEEGKTSNVMKSPVLNRKFYRREGVAEKNKTERLLVKETVKVITKTTHINEYNFDQWKHIFKISCDFQDRLVNIENDVRKPF